MKKKLASLFILGLTAGCLSAVAYADDATPTLSVESNLFGSVYTNGKSTLKYHLNTTLSYAEDSSAVLTLTLPDGSPVDDSKIDSSNATVILDEGDGYYPSEYLFHATTLDGEWQNGSLTYTLDDDALELDLTQYPLADLDSGREWSCLGGDGHGNYHFNLTVSGILYDGKPVESQTFPLDILVYGYNYSDDAVNLYGENGTEPIQPEFASLSDKSGAAAEAQAEPIFTWVGAGEVPILCDHLADDFYITWNADADASALTSADVTITLANERGDSKVLVADQDYFVQSDKGETQIALTYQNWAFIPVYTTMTIEVNGEGAAAAQTFDIGSVYVYEAQQGGGGQTVDGTVTAYSFYGLANLESWDQLLSPAIYLLSCEKDGTTFYYAEDENGTASLTEDMAQAFQFDASGPEDRNEQLIGNTLYVTSRQVMREVEKTVGEETITFKQAYPGRDSAISAGGGLLNPSACDPELKAAPGYVIPWGTTNWITNEKWAWQKGIEEGWIGISVTPYQGKFEWSVQKGASEQFTSAVSDVTWQIFGDVDEGTSVSQDGLLTIAENESHPSFAVTVTDKDGNLGTVTIKVTKPE